MLYMLNLHNAIGQLYFNLKKKNFNMKQTKFLFFKKYITLLTFIDFFQSGT